MLTVNQVFIRLEEGIERANYCAVRESKVAQEPPPLSCTLHWETKVGQFLVSDNARHTKSRPLLVRQLTNLARDIKYHHTKNKLT